MEDLVNISGTTSIFLLTLHWFIVFMSSLSIPKIVHKKWTFFAGDWVKFHCKKKLKDSFLLIQGWGWRLGMHGFSYTVGLVDHFFLRPHFGYTNGHVTILANKKPSCKLTVRSPFLDQLHTISRSFPWFFHIELSPFTTGQWFFLGHSYDPYPRHQDHQAENDPRPQNLTQKNCNDG
jgi:hypothetical protein